MNMPLKRTQTTHNLSQNAKRQKSSESPIDFSHVEGSIETKLALIKAFPQLIHIFLA